MIVITGAAGFIGSQLLLGLRKAGYHALLAVDNFNRPEKTDNIASLTDTQQMERDAFLPWLQRHSKEVEFIFHMGARTNTSEQDTKLLHTLNTAYSQEIFSSCAKAQIPLVYASSAATYGDGVHGFSDDITLIPQLKPRNPYAASKHTFDLWVLTQHKQPYFWAGLKLFNVYGQGEGHKGRMASVIHHANQQISKDGKIRLFKSYRKKYAHGMQLRDFVYVQDVINICLFFMHTRKNSSIYNVGTGQARSFLDLAKVVTATHKLPPSVKFIDMPKRIRTGYQYYTQAEISKLKKVGYTRFHTLEEGVADFMLQLKA